MEYYISDDKQINIEDRIISDEMLASISEKIKKLHPTYADVITLRYFYNYTNDEIAKMLDISKENVRVRLCRGRQNLLKILFDEKNQEISRKEIKK